MLCEHYLYAYVILYVVIMCIQVEIDIAQLLCKIECGVYFYIPKIHNAKICKYLYYANMKDLIHIV